VPSFEYRDRLNKYIVEFVIHDDEATRREALFRRAILLVDAFKEKISKSVASTLTIESTMWIIMFDPKISINQEDKSRGQPEAYRLRRQSFFARDRW
jgi:hypothetical protein